MTTKSKTGRATINFHNVDNIKFMQALPDNYYDLLICDPEYGIKQGGDKNHTRSKLAKSKDYHSFNDDKCPDQIYFDEVLRISKNQIVWGANHFIERINKNSSCWIIWDKENGDNDFADCEIAWTSFKTAIRIFKFRWQGMLQCNMKNKQIRIHPNEKPIQLYKWILTNYAKKGFKIGDMNGGGGSIALACWDLGFDLDLCELDTDYFSDSWKRFDWHTRQQQLF